jgi:hypothetical protein
MFWSLEALALRWTKEKWMRTEAVETWVARTSNLGKAEVTGYEGRQ